MMRIRLPKLAHQLLPLIKSSNTAAGGGNVSQWLQQKFFSTAVGTGDSTDSQSHQTKNTSAGWNGGNVISIVALIVATVLGGSQVVSYLDGKFDKICVRLKEEMKEERLARVEDSKALKEEMKEERMTRVEDSKALKEYLKDERLARAADLKEERLARVAANEKLEKALKEDLQEERLARVAANEKLEISLTKTNEKLEGVVNRLFLALPDPMSKGK